MSIVGWIPSATAYCVGERITFHLKKKLVKDDGSGQDVIYGN